MIHCVKDWMIEWEQNAETWTTIRGSPVINKTDLLELKEAIQKFEYVRMVIINKFVLFK